VNPLVNLTATLPAFPVVTNDHRKLIVTISYEQGSGGNVTGITYGSQSLTPTGKPSSVTRDAEIWYLDDPNVGVADIVATFASPSTAQPRIAAMSVSGAADDFGPIQPGDSTSPNLSLSVDLTTDATDTLVVGCYNINSGAGTITTPSVFEELIMTNGNSGSSTSNSGYVRVAEPSTTTFTWTNATAQPSGAVLVGFPAEPGFVQPPVPPSLKNFCIPKVSTAPVIDGMFSTGEWANAFSLEMKYPDLIFAPNYGGINLGGQPITEVAPEDISATLYYSWDDTYLYVGLEVTDDVFIAKAPGGNGFPDDHFLFAFNPGAPTNPREATFMTEFFVASDNTSQAFFRSDIANPALASLANHGFAGTTDGQNWKYEVRLKWTDIKGDPGYVPVINDVFGTNVLLCDNDQADALRDVFLYSAGGGSTAFTTPSIWSTVTLAGVAGGPNTFADWMAYFPAVGAEDGLNDDADGDGKKNGIENFFGTRPDVFSPGLVAGAVNKVSNTFTFTHPVNICPADDLTATYRWSTDLTSFQDDGAANAGGTTTVTFAPGTPSGGMVTVVATITGSVIPDKLFVDVEVVQTP
jgi:hypothetical protein